MFSIIFRRLQKFLWLIKALVIVLSLVVLGYQVSQTTPSILGVVVFCLTLFLFLLTAMSIFFRTQISLLVALSVSFILFLRAVDLLTVVNLTLFAAFVAFLGFYLYKSPQEKVKYKAQ